MCGSIVKIYTERQYFKQINTCKNQSIKRATKRYFPGLVGQWLHVHFNTFLTFSTCAMDVMDKN